MPRTRVLQVIPARYGSTRFPGKALADLGGRPVLEHVFDRARRAERPGWKTIVATDDRRIFEAAAGFGAEVVMTSRRCTSGSDRCAAVARKFPGYPIVVNLQGDEPFQHPRNIQLAVRCLLASSCPVATLVTACSGSDISNPNVAKAAVSAGRAIFFSRSAIPFDRDRTGVRYLKHIGLYVFRRKFLLTFSKWPETPLEKIEKLEQLRILEHGYSIAAAVTPHDSTGIDTPADLQKSRRRLGSAR